MSAKAPPGDSADRALAAGVFAVLALAYWVLRSRSFGAGDGAEHVVAALTWGVPRPPGYPLQTALAHFFALLPLGPAAGRVDGLSGLLHAAAAALFFRLLRRWVCGRPAALVATALLAFSPLWWYYSEVAEVRALNDLLAIGALYVVVRAGRADGDGTWLGLGALLGLGLSHHPTFVLILPALAALLWKKTPARGLGLLAVSSAVFAALPYVLLGLRLHLVSAPLFNPDAVRSWSDVLGLALRRRTGGLLGMASAGAPLGAAPFDARLLVRALAWSARSAWSGLTPPGLLLAGLGAWRAWKDRPRVLAALAAWLACAGPVFSAVSSQQLPLVDPDYLRAIMARFDLLPLIALFALAGLGAEAVLHRVRRPWAWALAALALVPALARPVSRRSCDPQLAYARALVADSGPKDFLLLAADDSIFAASYLDLVEGSFGDRVVLAPWMFGDAAYVAGLARRHPDLTLPRDENGALSRRLGDWLALNPDRALLAEATLASALPECPRVVPSGVLLRCGGPAPSPAALAAAARRFADEAETVFPRSCEPYEFTQDVYLPAALAAMGREYAARLAGPLDPAPAEKLSSAHGARAHHR